MRRWIAALGLIVGLAGCGNADVLSPVEVAQNYMYAIAEGNYAGACALLDQHTRARLVSSTGRDVSCPRLFARCLRNSSTILRHDQAQLLYANADLQLTGSRADVRLSGTAVATAARQVTLVDRHMHWSLTSPGKAITRCVRASRRHRPRGRGRAGAGG
ncbi:MAG: hypothetical protein ABI323_05610 [Solirubrobacteraceae bacterium]